MGIHDKGVFGVLTMERIVIVLETCCIRSNESW